jgi:Putative beta-barrel porin-2, OmpL-like. bbp2
MKKALKILSVVLLACAAATASPVFADDAKPTVSADELKKALGMSIYVQGGYTYNGNASSNATSGSENDLRWLDHKANSFGLDLMELVFAKDPSVGVIGYKVKISGGETAKLIHSAGLGDAGQDAIDLTEAYLSYTAPIGSGLRFDAGKMGTFIGAEVMEAIDNPNYSRSFLFSYAEPLTHTGVKAGYAFNDNVNAALFLLNGWDNVDDNNAGKSIGASVNVSAGDLVSAYINYLEGPEQANDSRDNRSLVDLVATIKPTRPLSFILNYDNGREKLGGALSDAKWNGLSGIVKYDLNDTFSVAFRGEFFDDKDGIRTGTVQKLTEETLTLEARLAGGLVLRPEYRHDSSDAQSFDNGGKKTQDTLALGMMYRW